MPDHIINHQSSKGDLAHHSPDEWLTSKPILRRSTDYQKPERIVNGNDTDQVIISDYL
ncbi:hypothetical protein KTE19_09570 [Lentilactobacillus sp. IMAU92037]|uniref:hypothetical protein n=1 Tax=Lentilactobacillus TaxID=2767893 RepID=UPI001C258A64|nr:MULTISPECIES: hypothetical protein [Lentilactobacillus]MBU9788805.1 hypothetical protein [Lentilactobacillus dabitei]MBV0930943.1 hypothetical protein [Lentilactobacillus dabitei]MDM7517397.1 hypothetical protein [Lentilactobacillus sp. TOM.63]